MNEIKSDYNYDEVIAWLNRKGKELFGTQFKIVENDLPIIYKLAAYFLKDQHAALQFNLDLSKGILLAGPVGCGKTSLLTIMKYLANQTSKYYVKPCREISFEFFDKGYAVIHEYGKGKQSALICFDDLGVENNLKHFGNECNIMAEIVLSRYDLFVAKKIPTHITTNLSATEIETYYGARVRSRLRSMVNLVAFDRKTPDKR